MADRIGQQLGSYRLLHLIGRGDFAGCIRTCEPLLNSLPKDSETHMEGLVMLGLAHAMLQHYQQSYDVFSEGIGIDPTRSELWYNHALSCHYMGRHAEAVRDLERAFELSKNDYLIVGTVDRAQLNRARQKPASFEHVVKCLHDFKEVVKFERVSE